MRSASSRCSLEWPKAQGKLDPAELPAAPDGFDAATFDRMAKVLTKWATVDGRRRGWLAQR